MKRKRGADILSPCHNAVVISAVHEGITVGICGTCGKAVARINPETGEREWLDGHPPSTKEPLRRIQKSEYVQRST